MVLSTNTTIINITIQENPLLQVFQERPPYQQYQVYQVNQVNQEHQENQENQLGQANQELL